MGFAFDAIDNVGYAKSAHSNFLDCCAAIRKVIAYLQKHNLRDVYGNRTMQSKVLNQ